MTVVAVVSVRIELNLCHADTVRLTAPTLADQVSYLTGQGLSVVQVADRLGISAWSAFEAGAWPRTWSDIKAVTATEQPPTPAEQAEIRQVAAEWLAMPVDDLAARYGVRSWTAGVMHNYANQKLQEGGRA